MSRRNFSTTEANASLTSKRSMSSNVMPAFSTQRVAAGPGAVSMMTGSVPATAVMMIRARGVMPWARAYSGDTTSTAEAPSTTPDELPAWCTWRISFRCG